MSSRRHPPDTYSPLDPPSSGSPPFSVYVGVRGLSPGRPLRRRCSSAPCRLPGTPTASRRDGQQWCGASWPRCQGRCCGLGPRRRSSAVSARRRDSTRSTLFPLVRAHDEMMLPARARKAFLQCAVRDRNRERDVYDTHHVYLHTHRRVHMFKHIHTCFKHMCKFSLWTCAHLIEVICLSLHVFIRCVSVKSFVLCTLLIFLSRERSMFRNEIFVSACNSKLPRQHIFCAKLRTLCLQSVP